jgi:ParB family chromosome partitioning protein
MKPTVTIQENKRRITLFRVPKGSPVRHHQLGDGLTVLGEGNILELPSRRGDTGAKRHFAEDRSPGEVEVAAAPKWLLDSAATDAQVGGAQVRGPRIVATRDIKIKDIVFRDRLRPVRPENVAKLAESLKTLGQTRAITVRPDPERDGKFSGIAGDTLIEAAKSLNWTRIRADIMECTEVEARLWEAMENLYRAELTALEEAEHHTECVRLIVEREAVSRQNVAKRKGGRPEGAIAKAARELPIKGKTQQARRKAIERGVKIGGIASDAKVAIRQAGLDDDQSVLFKVAKEDTAEDQLVKIKEIVRRKTLPKGKVRVRKKGSARVASASSLSAEDKAVLARLMEMWNDARELKNGLAKASSAVQGRFVEEIRQSFANNDDDQEDTSAGKDDENGDENDDEDDGEDHVGEQANDDDWTP